MKNFGFKLAAICLALILYVSCTPRISLGESDVYHAALEYYAELMSSKKLGLSKKTFLPSSHSLRGHVEEIESQFGKDNVFDDYKLKLFTRNIFPIKATTVVGKEIKMIDSEKLVELIEIYIFLQNKSAQSNRSMDKIEAEHLLDLETRIINEFAKLDIETFIVFNNVGYSPNQEKATISISEFIVPERDRMYICFGKNLLLEKDKGVWKVREHRDW